jgi:hypothetical protein
VAHTCKASYSGGREHEDHSLKPVWANSSQDPISKKPITKKGWWSGSGVGPEFKPQYYKTNKKPSKFLKRPQTWAKYSQWKSTYAQGPQFNPKHREENEKTSNQCAYS